MTRVPSHQRFVSPLPRKQCLCETTPPFLGALIPDGSICQLASKKAHWSFSVHVMVLCFRCVLTSISRSWCRCRSSTGSELQLLSGRKDIKRPGHQKTRTRPRHEETNIQDRQMSLSTKNPEDLGLLYSGIYHQQWCTKWGLNEIVTN